MVGLVHHWDTRQAGRDLMAFVVASYTAAYPDVKAAHYLKPAAVPVVRWIAPRCGMRAAEVWIPAVQRAVETSLLDRSPTSGRLATRLRENTPVDPVAPRCCSRRAARTKWCPRRCNAPTSGSCVREAYTLTTANTPLDPAPDNCHALSTSHSR